MEKEVFLKKVGDLLSGPKKDGSDKWFARELTLEANDNCLHRDVFLVRYTGEKAIDPQLDVGKLYKAEIVFSVRNYNGRDYMDTWLKSFMPVEATTNEDKPF